MNTSVTFFDFKISNQIRYEYRFTPDWNDYRIKNTLEISRPDIFLQPYIGWELYYENRDKAVMLNRIKFGIIKNIDSNISLGPYYRIDFSNINHQWELTRQLIGFQITHKILVMDNMPTHKKSIDRRHRSSPFYCNFCDCSSSCCLFYALGVPFAQADNRVVRVGVYENAPKVFTSESGKPSGIFIDIIEHIAKSEGWNLQYVSGTWVEGLDRLAKGEIDLMPDVAYTAEREKIYSFHKVPVLSSWYQVYAPKGQQYPFDIGSERKANSRPGAFGSAGSVCPAQQRLRLERHPHSRAGLQNHV